MDKGKGRFWTAFTFLCVAQAWLIINVVWWTQNRRTDDLVIPAVLFLLGIYLFFREKRRIDRE